MLIAAAATAARRVEHGPPRSVLFPRAIAAIGAGGLVALVPVFAAVVPLHPWYEARYLVPISGMMLSNAMNVVALVFERIFASTSSEADQVEALLALGATPRQALERQVRATLRAALLPTINGLLTVGLVALPGMMTGQIVSGTKPTSRNDQRNRRRPRDASTPWLRLLKLPADPLHPQNHENLFVERKLRELAAMSLLGLEHPVEHLPRCFTHESTPRISASDRAGHSAARWVLAADGLVG